MEILEKKGKSELGEIDVIGCHIYNWLLDYTLEDILGIIEPILASNGYEAKIEPYYLNDKVIRWKGREQYSHYEIKINRYSSKYPLSLSYGARSNGWGMPCETIAELIQNIYKSCGIIGEVIEEKKPEIEEKKPDITKTKKSKKKLIEGEQLTLF